MPNTSSYAWYVEPRDDVAHANKVISRLLVEEVDDGASMWPDALCADGKRHTLWHCPSADVAGFIWNSQDNLSFRIRVWASTNKGRPRDCTLIFTSKMRRRIRRQRAERREHKQKATRS